MIKDKIGQMGLFPLFLFLLIFLFFGCEKSKSTGGESIIPEGPYIVESVLSKGILEGNPSGITDEFWIGDTVYLWVQWEHVIDTHNVEARFWEPSGDLADSVLLDLFPSERLVTIFFYVLKQFQAPPGQWEVGIYLDGEFLRSHLFWVYQEGKDQLIPETEEEKKIIPRRRAKAQDSYLRVLA